MIKTPNSDIAYGNVGTETTAFKQECIANAIADAKAEQMHANLAKVEHHGYAPHEIVR